MTADLSSFEPEFKRVNKLLADNGVAFEKANRVAYEYVQEGENIVRKLRSIELQLNETTRAQYNLNREQGKFSLGSRSVYPSSPSSGQDQLLKQYNDSMGSKLPSYITDTTKSMDKLTRSTKDLDGASQSVLISWKSIGRLLVVQTLHRSIASTVSALRDGFTASLDLQSKFLEIRAISQDIPLSIQTWATELAKVSSKWGADLFDVTEGAYQALSNQVAKGRDAILFVDEAMKLSAATASTATEAVNALSSVLNAYGESSSSAAKYAAQLFKTVELGRVRLGEMSNNLGDIVILASNLGIPFEEVAAGITMMTNQGMKFNKTATQIRGALNKLLKPTEEMQGLFDSFGVSSGEALVKLIGFPGIIESIKDETGGASNEVARYFNTMRGMLFGVAVTSERTSELYKQSIDKIKNSMETYEAAAKERLNSPLVQFQSRMKEVQNMFRVDFGPAIINTLAEISTHFTNLDLVVKSFTQTLLVAGTGMGMLALIKGIKFLAFESAKYNAALAAGLAIYATLTFAANMYTKTLVKELDGVREELAAVNKEYDRTLSAMAAVDADLMKELERPLLTMAARTNAVLSHGMEGLMGQNELLKESYEGIFKKAESGAKDFEDAYKDAIDNIRDGIKSLDGDIKNQGNIIDGINKAIIESGRELKEVLLDASLDGLDPTAGIQKLDRYISQMREAAAKATDLETHNYYTSQIKSAIKEKNSLATEINEKNKEIDEERAEIADQITESKQKLLDLEREYQNTREQDKKNELFTARNEQVRELGKLEAELKGKVKTAVPDFNLSNEYASAIAEQQAQLMKMREAAQAEELRLLNEKHNREIALKEALLKLDLANIRKKAESERQENLLTAARKNLDAFDLEKALPSVRNQQSIDDIMSMRYQSAARVKEAGATDQQMASVFARLASEQNYLQTQLLKVENTNRRDKVTEDLKAVDATLEKLRLTEAGSTKAVGKLDIQIIYLNDKIAELTSELADMGFVEGKLIPQVGRRNRDEIDEKERDLNEYLKLRDSAERAKDKYREQTISASMARSDYTAMAAGILKALVDANVDIYGIKTQSKELDALKTGPTVVRTQEEELKQLTANVQSLVESTANIKSAAEKYGETFTQDSTIRDMKNAAESYDFLSNLIKNQANSTVSGAEVITASQIKALAENASDIYNDNRDIKTTINANLDLSVVRQAVNDVMKTNERMGPRR
jgi:TP901 family phage tail tape measure protein